MFPGSGSTFYVTLRVYLCVCVYNLLLFSSIQYIVTTPIPFDKIHKLKRNNFKEQLRVWIRSNLFAISNDNWCLTTCSCLTFYYVFIPTPSMWSVSDRHLRAGCGMDERRLPQLVKESTAFTLSRCCYFRISSIRVFAFSVFRCFGVSLFRCFELNEGAATASITSHSLHSEHDHIK